MTDDAFLDGLAAALVPRIIARLAGVTTSSLYSTEVGCWPPGCRSRRHARDRIRAVPGHEHEGIGRASRYYVAADDYRAHYTHRSAHCARVASTDEREAARRDLAAAGLRPTRIVATNGRHTG